MKSYLLTFLLVVFIFSCEGEYFHNGTVYIDSASVQVSNFLDLGVKPKELQGMDVFENNVYQFYNHGVCKVFDCETKELIKNIQAPKGHYGSVVFSSIYQTASDELPLLYVGGPFEGKINEGYVVVNMNSGEVEYVEFDQPVAASVLCTFDFSHGIGYSFGYQNNDPDHEVAPYEVTPFEIETGKCDIANRFYIMNEGHLQDAFFKDGRIYIITGWNRQWNGENVPIKIFGVDPNNKRMTMVMNLGFVNNEGEGIAWYKDGFLISVRKLYKMLYVTYQ